MDINWPMSGPMDSVDNQPTQGDFEVEDALQDSMGEVDTNGAVFSFDSLIGELGLNFNIPMVAHWRLMKPVVRKVA